MDMLDTLKVHLMCGLPGSGKTTFVQDKGFGNVFSQDRYWHRPDGIYDYNPMLKEACAAWFYRQVQRSMTCDTQYNTLVLDNTYLKREHREEILRFIRKCATSIHRPIYAICYEFEANPDLSMHLRGLHAKDLGMLQDMYNKFERPTDTWREEGFDKLIYVPWKE